MSRIRSIKPSRWTESDFVPLSPYARLLLLGASNFTLCDYGHLADDPLALKLQVLPADDVDAAALVEELLAIGRLSRFEAGGRTFLLIERFGEDQKIDKRWTPRCPACQALRSSPDLPETPRSSPNLPESRPRTGQDRTGEDSAAAAADARPRANRGGGGGEQLPTALAILADKLRAHTPLRGLRFDRLTDDQQQALLELVEVHGDGPLVDVALRTLRNPPPVSVTAFLGTWQALPPPGRRLAPVPEAECPQHPGKPARSCTGCAADRLAGDA